MGMTIDDATLYMELYKRKLLNSVSDLHKDIEAYDLAIETLRKYQKIVQIMERTVDDGTSMYDTLQEIEEVIEDGNDD